jgi:hypothetical protein
MKTLSKFRCVIVGNDALRIVCAEILSSDDREMCNIITADPEVQS